MSHILHLLLKLMDLFIFHFSELDLHGQERLQLLSATTVKPRENLRALSTTFCLPQSFTSPTGPNSIWSCHYNTIYFPCAFYFLWPFSYASKITGINSEFRVRFITDFHTDFLIGNRMKSLNNTQERTGAQSFCGFQSVLSIWPRPLRDTMLLLLLLLFLSPNPTFQGKLNSEHARNRVRKKYRVSWAGPSRARAYLIFGSPQTTHTQ